MYNDDYFGLIIMQIFMHSFASTDVIQFFKILAKHVGVSNMIFPRPSELRHSRRSLPKIMIIARALYYKIFIPPSFTPEK